MFRYILIINCLVISQVAFACNSEDEISKFMKENGKLSNEQLVELSDKSVLAQAYLGIRFTYGDVYPNDAKESIRWFSQASSNGCTYADYELGMIYFTGRYGKPNYIEAYKYFIKSEGFNHWVNIGLGEIYARGLGVPKNPEKAFAYFLSQPSKESSLGKVWLALMLFDWEGIIPDHEQAKIYITDAAQDGLPEAQFALGNYYEEGKYNFRKDIPESIKWYKKAAEQGFLEAKIKINFLKDSNAR